MKDKELKVPFGGTKETWVDYRFDERLADICRRIHLNQAQMIAALDELQLLYWLEEDQKKLH